MTEPWDTWSTDLVRLRAFEPADLPAAMADERDSEANQRGGLLQAPRSLATWEKMMAEPLPGGAADASLRLAIESRETEEIAGAIQTRNVMARWGMFDYGLNIYRPYWRKGYASEALRLVLRYYFDELRFEKANGGVFAFNEPSLAFHRAMGFTEEGRTRSAIFTSGKRHDEVRFGITADEFRAAHADWLERWRSPGMAR